MRKKALSLLLFLCTTIWAQQDDALRLRMDFGEAAGSTVEDAVSGIAARVVSPAHIVEMGKYRVLDLGNGAGYLDLTASVGALFADCTDYTVSVFYRVGKSASLAGNGYFLWAFSNLAANTATTGPYTAYRLNAQRVAASTGGYTNETGYETGGASAQGCWTHVAYTQTETTGRLYINGTLAGTVEGMPLNSSLYANALPAYCWIGRAPFSGDNYLRNTLVYDFRLYDRALSAYEIGQFATETASLDNAYNHGSTGDNMALLSAIANANAIIGNAAAYLPDAVGELTAMRDMAQTVANGTFCQDYMDDTAERLNSLVTAVRATQGVVLPNLSQVGAAYDTERGFVHPGGLHTQADFDRVKALLAAGNERVTAAYNVLRNAEYAQPTIATWPTEVVNRGGSSTQNYLNAARGAAMAYQNGLRWKIEGNTDCAAAAVRILMQWANTTRLVTGDSNYALAAGLYGYQFAQAAELVRDYEGWAKSDFEAFKDWMLRVWYAPAIGFLRGRNGTWENAGKWWQAPGHYWSNWPLCNIMCLISIGILCDDVFIYNQGMSYFKYDQVGTFENPRTASPILGNGLTDFLGNLVVTTTESELETGAYGRLGQMQESARDTGHPAMALGLAVDVAKVGWNQGDDLFAYMDHRLAAGIEYIAAQTQSVENLPWTDFHYYSSGYAWTDSRSWLMTGPVLGVEGWRPYWGNVIGIYEGVKGVRMPFSEITYNNMGIDGGGAGGTSGGYDHLGYSVLMNTRDPQLAPTSAIPTELSPKMQYSGSLEGLVPSLGVENTLGNVDGNVVAHNELGGLVNNFYINNNTCVPAGETLTLMPQLPDGESDTGLWQWNTGETTRQITVATNRSFVYRVTYTNARGIKSQQCFPIAVAGDGKPDVLRPFITHNGVETETATATVLYGSTIAMHPQADRGWGTYLWSTGETAEFLTTRPILRDCDYTAYFKNQSGTWSAQTFHINVVYHEPYIVTEEGTTEGSSATVVAGSKVVLGLRLPDITDAESVTWSNGSHGASITVSPNGDATYTATYQAGGTTQSQTFALTVFAAETIEGKRYLCNVETGMFLTAGNSWGTQGTLGETGVDFTITANGAGYTLDSGFNNGGTNQFFGPDLFLDNTSTTWFIAPTGMAEGKSTYTLTADGTNYLTAPASGNVVVTTTSATDTKAQWMIFNPEEMLERMAKATEESPVNATFLLPAYNFGRNDTRNGLWQGNPVIAGDKTNQNAEKFSTNFDVYQELTDLPNGIYELSVQGFYRYGGHGANPATSARAAGTETIHAFLYAGSEQTALPSIFEGAGKNGTKGVSSSYGYVPDSQDDGSSYMSAGLYWSRPVRTIVENGTLRVGIRKTTTITNDWTLFDNFRLMYLGTGCGNGDVNRDDSVDMADVVALVGIVLGKDSGDEPLYDHAAADVNGDRTVTIADVTTLVNRLLAQ